MTWVRIDDTFPENLKVEEAGVPASWLFVAALCYCARQLTDGWVPKSMIPRLTSIKAAQTHAKRLVSVGLFQDKGDRFYIPDFLEFNPSRDEVMKKRQKRSEAGRIGGSKRSSKAEANAQANAQANASGFASTSRKPPPPPQPLSTKYLNAPSPSSVGDGGDEEVANRLLEKGYPPADVDIVIERLVDRRLSPNPVTDVVAWCSKLLENLGQDRARAEKRNEPVVAEIDGETMRYDDETRTWQPVGVAS